MGYNTVAVIYNDHQNDILRGGQHSAERLYNAMKEFNVSRGDYCDALTGNFGFGKVVSCEHADYDQIVVVGQNYGGKLRDVDNPSAAMLIEIKEFMEKHGYRVTKKRK